jgi:hypothetical protein
VVGLSLGLLPLLQGQWQVAAVAAIVGGMVLAGWSIGTSSDRRVGIAVGAGLAATMVAVFVVSQWPRGPYTPPYIDWLLCWLLIGVGCVVGLVVDASVHRARARRLAEPARSAARSAAGAPGVAVGMIATLLVCGCCGLGFTLEDDRGALRFFVADEEVLPLPPTLQLVSADQCAGSGASGNCTAEFVVTAADDADQATTVGRIVGHLRHLGWPLEQRGESYRGCRKSGGVLPWSPHCLWLDTDRSRPGAIVISVDNS